jgi:hypothetical protein
MSPIATALLRLHYGFRGKATRLWGNLCPRGMCMFPGWLPGQVFESLVLWDEVVPAGGIQGHHSKPDRPAGTLGRRPV